jgi:hypothetical protein
MCECGTVCIPTNELQKRVAAVKAMSGPASCTESEDERLTIVAGRHLSIVRYLYKLTVINRPKMIDVASTMKLPSEEVRIINRDECIGPFGSHGSH